jgi:2-polyprenyl-6-methoxyphenol hydroxylase-like FAD-dependent oxidoreductase
MSAEVLVVGAGPVGMLMACELARRGLPVRLIDMGSGPSTTSKALGVMPRTLEIMDIIGLSGRFLAAGQSCPNVQIATPSRTLASVSFKDLPSAFPFIAMVPQNATEAIFTDRLRELGVQIEYGTKLVQLREHPDSVAVVLEAGPATREEASFAYVCACDGAHSTLRDLLEVPYEGATYPDRFLLADVVLDIDLAEDTLFLYPGKTGPLAIFPMGNGRRRLVAVGENVAGDVSEAEITALFAARGPKLRGIKDIIWTSRFAIHRRRASAMRRGRVFLLGDAAHTHSPFGAQGMNTGLQDAWNLVWKLAAVLQGRSPESLLDSYERERSRVARDVLRQTDFITRVMASPNQAVNSLRAFVLPRVGRSRLFRDTFTRVLSEIGVRYPRSPIVSGDGMRVTAHTLGLNGASRAFDEHIAAGRFVLVAHGADRGQATMTRIQDTFDAAIAIVQSSRPDPETMWQIVRPDGHSAGTFAPEEADDMFDLLRKQLLPRQLATSS